MVIPQDFDDANHRRRFFNWLTDNNKLDFYEDALDVSEDYSRDQNTRLRASDDVYNLTQEYKNK